jgi:hypothetical protein
MPSFLAGQKLTATLLNQIGTYTAFWANPPMFRMYQSVAQPMPNGAFAQILMDAGSGVGAWDTDSGRSGTSPYSYIIPVGMTGRWRFNWKVGFSSNATGVRAAQLYKNGSSIGDEEFINAPASGAASYVLGTASVLVNAGDVLSAWGYQSSGAPLNTDTNSPSFFEGELQSLASP